MSEERFAAIENRLDLIEDDVHEVKVSIEAINDPELQKRMEDAREQFNLVGDEPKSIDAPELTDEWLDGFFETYYRHGGGFESSLRVALAKHGIPRVDQSARIKHLEDEVARLKNAYYEHVRDYVKLDAIHGEVCRRELEASKVIGELSAKLYAKNNRIAELEAKIADLEARPQLQPLDVDLVVKFLSSEVRADFHDGFRATARKICRRFGASYAQEAGPQLQPLDLNTVFEFLNDEVSADFYDGIDETARSIVERFGAQPAQEASTAPLPVLVTADDVSDYTHNKLSRLTCLEEKADWWNKRLASRQKFVTREQIAKELRSHNLIRDNIDVIVDDLWALLKGGAQ